jgi:hypothetical protein
VLPEVPDVPPDVLSPDVMPEVPDVLSPDVLPDDPDDPDDVGSLVPVDDPEVSAVADPAVVVPAIVSTPDVTAAARAVRLLLLMSR